MIRNIERTEVLLDELLRLCADSVRTTHYLLASDDVERLVPVVRQALATVAGLAVAWHGKRPVGWVGIEGCTIVMLFVASACRGCGFGRRLAELAIREQGCCLVDVHACNVQAEGFYRHLGFVPFGCSDTDEPGSPSPKLRMKRP